MIAAVFRARGAESRRVGTTVSAVHAYDLRGRGERTFVLVHVMAATATTFASVLPRLRRSAARVVLVELPAHGRSEPCAAGLATSTLATGLREALDELVRDGEHAVVLGTSLGGAAALRYALDRPSRVRALVLASP